MAKLPPIEGCLTALVTPFRDGAVDYDALTRLVDWQIDCGIDGLVAVGTTGESATLDVDEHVAVISHVVRVARGRVPVVAGAGGNATAEALALTAASQKAGAQALLHVTPYYNKPTQEGLFRHYSAIAASTTLPILLYNVPSRTSCDLLPDTVERLAEIPNIVGIKEASGSLPRITELVARVGQRMAVISGDDATTFPTYAVGGRGVISVVSNIAPREMAQMWDLAREGQWDAARALHHRLRVLNQLLFVESNPIPVKAALAAMGRCTSEVRLPLVPCSAGLAKQLGAELATVGLL
ncbi:MAG: 4-hydroxy-tetrahydrodipicolinate synthase [Myxococcales bacterium]|nr:4-hydroxy-tetrahydrodipicolinate synthase [Myxococcales bacterium]